MATNNRNQSIFDIVNVILGLCLVLEPLLFGYSGLAVAAWNAWLIGAAIVIFGLAALLAFAEWQEWTNAVLGVFLLLAPWILNYSGSIAASFSQVAIGLLVVIVSTIALLVSAATRSTN